MNQRQFEDIFWHEKIHFHDGNVNFIGYCTAALWDFDDGVSVVGILCSFGWFAIRFPAKDWEEWRNYFEIMK